MIKCFFAHALSLASLARSKKNNLQQKMNASGQTTKSLNRYFLLQKAFALHNSFPSRPQSREKAPGKSPGNEVVHVTDILFNGLWKYLKANFSPTLFHNDPTPWYNCSIKKGRTLFARSLFLPSGVGGGTPRKIG